MEDILNIFQNSSLKAKSIYYAFGKMKKEEKNYQELGNELFKKMNVWYLYKTMNEGR